MKEYFTILRLTREDLKINGIRGKFSDKEMTWIANKLGELYCETDLSQTLVDLCEEIKERRK